MNIRGMTIKEFNDALNDMHKVYPFKNDKTRICDIYNPRNNCFNNVEIRTQDEETGVWVHLSKDIEPSWENEY